MKLSRTAEAGAISIFCTAGGSAGIGKATALAFDKNGCKVAVLGRRKERLDAVVSTLCSALLIRRTINIQNNGSWSLRPSQSIVPRPCISSDRSGLQCSCKGVVKVLESDYHLCSQVVIRLVLEFVALLWCR